MRKFVVVCLLVSSAFVAISFSLAYAAYFANPPFEFNYIETLASLSFWAPVLLLVFLFPLKSTLALFSRYIRTARGVLVFATYLVAHLILYGLLLEMILDYPHKFPEITSQSTISVTSSVLYPLSFPAMLTSFGFYPSLSILLPPSFNLVLSLYSFTLALVIAILVAVNVMRVLDLGKMCAITQRARAFVLLPALGVIGGAACCLSLPLLIALAAPTAVLFSDSPVVYYTAYILFPCAAALGLKFNLDSMNRMASSLEKLKESLGNLVANSRN
jgi:hypothetical protein